MLPTEQVGESQQVPGGTEFEPRGDIVGRYRGSQVCPQARHAVRGRGAPGPPRSVLVGCEAQTMQSGP